MRQIWDRAAPEALPALERKLGFSIADAERLIAIVPTIDVFTGRDGPFATGHPQAKSALLVVTVTKPYDRAKLRRGFSSAGRDKTYQGKTYFFDDDSWCGLYFVNDRTFLVGSEDSVMWLLDQSAKKAATGRLTQALANAAGPSPIVVAFNVTKLPEEMDQVAPPPIRPLLKTQAVVLTADFEKEFNLELKLLFAQEGQAREGEGALKAARELGRQGLAMGIQEMIQRLQAPEAKVSEVMGYASALGFLRHADAILQSLPIERKGQVVQVAIHGDLTYGNPAVWIMVSLVAIGNIGRSATATFESVAGQLAGPGGAPPAAETKLKQIAAALDKYHEAKGSYPPPAIYGKNGEALLSWRVALLPYLGEDELYKEFKLDEPYDSFHNKRLLSRMPKVFGPEYSFGPPAWKTQYQGFSGPGAVFDGKKGTRRADITDPKEQTLLVVQTDPEHAIAWTRPADLPFAANKPLPPFQNKYGFGATALFADGSVRVIPKDTPEATIKALITRAGGEKVTLP